MRTGLQRGLASTGLAIALLVAAVPAAAGSAASLVDPSGEWDLDAPISSESDSLLDDEFDSAFEAEFDAQLERESDMARSDPFESANRKVFAFNRGVNRYVLNPVLKGYRFAVPGPARKSIRRVFLNLESPRIFVNDVLQLRFADAGRTLGRLVLNSVLGVGGLLDAGAAAGWERHDSDFGQTLAKAGVPSGPYIVVPVFGPNTVRDGLGNVVDLTFQPLTYILGPAQLMIQLYMHGGVSLTALEQSHDKIAALEVASVDFYAAMRSAYLQHRWANTGELEAMEGAVADDEFVPLEERAGGGPVEFSAHVAN
jgi:phospholipid-binding lipoprotein MlaA